MQPWSNNDRTSDAFFNRTSSRSGRHQVEVRVAVDSEFGANTLLYSTTDGGSARICPEQMAFVEHQPTDGAALRRMRFYAASARHRDWLMAARSAGRIVRAWDFESEHGDDLLAVSFPATNEPYAD